MNLTKEQQRDLDKESLTSEQFFDIYGYYAEDEYFDWETPLEFGDN